MSKPTTELFEATRPAEQAKVNSLGASLLLHIALCFTLVALPVTHVERWEDVERRVIVPLTFPSMAALENLNPLRLEPPARERVRAYQSETPAPAKVTAPAPATAPIEPPLLVAPTAQVPVLPRAVPPPVPAPERPVRTGLLPDVAAAPPRQEPPKLRVQAGKFTGTELGGVQRRSVAATRTGVFEVSAEARTASARVARRIVVAANFGGSSLGGDSRGWSRGKVATASSFGAATVREVLGEAGETVVRRTAFEDIVVEQPPRERPGAKREENLSSPVQIIEKLHPAYTAAAREQRIEGEVLLDVLFGASGTIQVLGIIKGLGYGLDARAAEATRKIRFKPAEREGKPVDSRARVRVTFQLAY